MLNKNRTQSEKKTDTAQVVWASLNEIKAQNQDQIARRAASRRSLDLAKREDPSSYVAFELGNRSYVWVVGEGLQQVSVLPRGGEDFTPLNSTIKVLAPNSAAYAASLVDRNLRQADAGCYAVVGGTGSGKSYFIDWLMKNERKAGSVFWAVVQESDANPAHHYQIFWNLEIFFSHLKSLIDLGFRTIVLDSLRGALFSQGNLGRGGVNQQFFTLLNVLHAIALAEQLELIAIVNPRSSSPEVYEQFVQDVSSAIDTVSLYRDAASSQLRIKLASRKTRQSKLVLSGVQSTQTNSLEFTWTDTASSELSGETERTAQTDGVYTRRDAIFPDLKKLIPSQDGESSVEQDSELSQLGLDLEKHLGKESE